MMRLASAWLALLGLGELTEVGADERCTAPTGGVIPLVNWACTEDTGRCFSWMNAECINGWCECKTDECIMHGQCVRRGDCPSLTGGTCAIKDCYKWRNASCSESSVSVREAQCTCGPGTCPVEGECRPPGTCAKSTDGSCQVWSCHAWRKATCSVQGMPDLNEEARCMCGVGHCPINGECVPDGSCPRYARSMCAVFSTLGLFPCSTGDCNLETGYCECPEGECYLDGQCVPATEAAIKRSRAWGSAQAPPVKAGRSEAFRMACGRALLLALATAVVSALWVLVKCRMRRRSAPAPDYECLEG
uniref:EGF-like domain-containing protein n=1 Tax=Alexandrium monilatum TaxID=311494 RepID=A0A7S4Q695_9DINO|mmetsp:Transcript_83625/g.249503  ORF Transcript_83625/g.249503 Transcript_83625/m.249503 type:complete len:304 (+) Transcript_83625:56-967(+)